MHGYPFSIGTSGYMKPIGGKSLALIPGVMATHSCIFMRVIMEIGGRATAVKLNTPDDGILVFSPIPWGPEAKSLLQVLEPEKQLKDINVKYLVAPDCEHHMALKSWKEQFPGLKILGPEALNAKKEKEGIKMDYAFTSSIGGKLLTAESFSTGDLDLALPTELTKEFDFAFFPAHPNKELVLLHKPTKTLITADLFFNLPAYEQYKGSGLSPTSGLSFLTRYLAIDSWLQRKTFGSALPESDGVALNAMYDWHFERIIPCHGDVLEGPDIRERFATLYGKYIKAKV